MSFRCTVCHVPQLAGTRPVAKVLERRDRIYSTIGGDIPGWEIAKESVACPPCAGEAQPAE